MSRSIPGLAFVLLVVSLIAAQDKPLPAKGPIVRLTIDAEGTTSVAGRREPFSSTKEIRDFLAQKVEKGGKLDVIIGLESRLEYARLLTILDACADVNIAAVSIHLADEPLPEPGPYELILPSRNRHIVTPLSEAHKEDLGPNIWEATLRLTTDPIIRGRLSFAYLQSLPSTEETIPAAELERVLLEKLKALPADLRGKGSRIALLADGDLRSRDLVFALESTRNAGIGKARIVPAEERYVRLGNLDHGLLPRPPWRYESVRPDENEPDVYVRFDPNDARGVVEYEESQGRLIPLSLDSPRRRDPSRSWWYRTLTGPDAPGGVGLRYSPKREKVLLEEGGSRASEAAVNRGLRWLALHQAPEGHWSLERFNEHAREHIYSTRYRDDRTTGKGMRNDVAGAAFGLLPFLAAGVTHKSAHRSSDDVYVNSVSSGLDYLLSVQEKDGGFPGGMYSHALATTAVCEAYALTRDRMLKRAAQAAVNYIVAAQDPQSGGWRYQPRQGGDMSVTGWQVTALKAGQVAGLKVPETTLDGARRWLNSCETTDGGGYGYVGPSDAPRTSAVGLLCRQCLGTPRYNPNHRFGVRKLMSSPPTGKDIYYEYYATQVLHNMGGEYWDYWNIGKDKQKGMRDILIGLQDRDGSWDPRGDPLGSAGGRIMQTSLSLLSLEVYYRHVPIYQRTR